MQLECTDCSAVRDQLWRYGARSLALTTLRAGTGAGAACKFMFEDAVEEYDVFKLRVIPSVLFKVTGYLKSFKAIYLGKLLAVEWWIVYEQNK